ncbi:MAG: DUF4854 domain-containing protein [Mogibacterium sp.]|mgnify:FL=1|nr:DUF4854 domain-containing protein [Mogibacterium sp.]
MNKRRLALILAVIAVVCFTLTACSKPKNLEEFAAKNSDFQKEMSDIEEQNAGLKIAFKENTVIFTYDVSNVAGVTESTATSDAVKANLNQSLESATSTFESKVKEISEETGYDGIKIQVIYTYKDTELASKTFG